MKSGRDFEMLGLFLAVFKNTQNKILNPAPPLFYTLTSHSHLSLSPSPSRRRPPPPRAPLGFPGRLAPGQGQPPSHSPLRDLPVVPLDDHFRKLRDVSLRLLFAPKVPLHVQPVAEVMVVDAVLRKLDPFRTQEVEDARDDVADGDGSGLGAAAELGLVVRLDRLHY